jgi:hypothetical protein
MTALISAYLVFAGIVYACTAKIQGKWRVMVALAAFIIPTIITVAWLEKVGDKPSPGAVTYKPEDFKK